MPIRNINVNQDLKVKDLNSEVSYCYEDLPDKPKINNVTLDGNRSLEDLGIVNDKNYLYIQNIASDIWVVNHNLNKYPAVSVIDSSGNEVTGDVEYIDVNNLVITFKGAFKGKATLN